MPRRAPSHKIQLGLVTDHLTQAQLDCINNTINVEVKTHVTGTRSFREERARKVLREMRLVVNTRMQSYGCAHYDTNTVEVASHCHGTDEGTDTLLHEIAHILNHALHGCDGHGKNWKRIAAAVGARPVRCGPATPITQATHPVEYTCKDCGYVYKRSRRFSNERYHSKCKHAKHGGALILTKHPNMERVRRELEW